MFKKPTKKQFIIRRIILSTVATAAVLIIVTATILLMLGYRFDSGNGRLEQGALLQFNSNPGDADVAIDGRSIGSRTATKQTVLAGQHTIKISKSGYQDWSRTIDLLAGTLTWLDYIRLVPADRPVADVTTYKTLTNLTFSPDSKWAIAQESATAPTYQLVDLRNEEVKSQSISVPSRAFTTLTNKKTKQSFTTQAWDKSSRYVMIKHIYGDQVEWIVFDTQNVNETVNLTKLLSVDLTDVQFASSNGRIFYGLTQDGTIRKINSADETISRALINQVDSFSIFDTSVLSYVGTDTADGSKKVAGVYRDGDASPRVLRTATAKNADLMITTGRYFSDSYVAIAEGNKVNILKGSLPTSSTQGTSSLKDFASLQLPGTVSSLSFSPRSDYLLAQSSSSFATYEIEHLREASGTLNPDAKTPAAPLQWLDTAYLWNDDRSQLTMRDFDNANVYDIMKVEAGFDATLGLNGRFFYAVGKNDTGYHLQRVKMIIE